MARQGSFGPAPLNDGDFASPESARAALVFGEKVFDEFRAGPSSGEDKKKPLE